jgi:hypothetical protein
MVLIRGFFCLLIFIVFSNLSSFGQKIPLDSVKIEYDTIPTIIPFLPSKYDSRAPADTLAFKKDTLSIIGVGDIMMGTNYPEDRLPVSNGSLLMKDVENILLSADITFGNLEGVLLDEGGIAKSCRDPKVCYVFRSPSSYVENLITAGFDLISVANNHAGDFGDAGRENTMNLLKEHGLAYAGQLQQEFTLLTKDGVTYGLAAFAPNTNCVNINDYQHARAIVQHLDSAADIVIVSFHGGAEGKAYQNVPRKHELFHGEDRGDVYEFSHLMVDAGADIIFGHGPHVTRGIEVYKNRFIAYSLGTFCTYKGINIAGINGWAPIIKVFTNPLGEFLKGEITATYQVYGVGVKIDPDNQVIKKILELSKKDFPESTISIDDKGIITYLDQL